MYLINMASTRDLFNMILICCLLTCFSAVSSQKTDKTTSTAGNVDLLGVLQTYISQEVNKQLQEKMQQILQGQVYKVVAEAIDKGHLVTENVTDQLEKKNQLHDKQYISLEQKFRKVQDELSAIKQCQKCEEWQTWEKWSSCNVSCGEGVKTRSRKCNGNRCKGSNQQTRSCNTEACIDRKTMSTRLVYPVAFADNGNNGSWVGNYIYITPMHGKTNITVSDKMFNNETNVEITTTYTHYVGAIYRTKSGTESKAIFVSSNRRLQVHGMNYNRFSADTFLALPLAKFSTSFYIASHYQRKSYQSMFMIISSNSTEVNITHPIRRLSKYIRIPAGKTFTMLHASDLTGTFIEASKPVAVIAGHGCAEVPQGNSYGCDHMITTSPPVEYLGKYYVVPPIRGKKTPTLIRVISTQDGNLITVPSISTQTINKSEFIELTPTSISKATIVNCSKPCMVTLYQTAANVDGTYGDVFMMNIIPESAFSEKFAWTVPVTDFDKYVTIVALSGETSGVRVDGFQVSEWSNAGDGLYSFATLNITSSYHTVHHVNPNSKMAVYMYGHKKWASFGLPVGFTMV